MNEKKWRKVRVQKGLLPMDDDYWQIETGLMTVVATGMTEQDADHIIALEVDNAALEEKCIEWQDAAAESETRRAEVIRENAALKAALEALDRDQHQFQDRPCATCRNAGEALGHDFGCEVRYKRRLARLQASPPAAGTKAGIGAEKE